MLLRAKCITLMNLLNNRYNANKQYKLQVHEKIQCMKNGYEPFQQRDKSIR